MAGKIQLGKSTSLDSMKLLEGRMLVVGNSGSGKSYLLRVLCEQVVDKIPTIILDREGEFSTLREKHDVALIGEGGEADVSVSTAAKLARTLVELGISAVINLSDLPSKTDKRRFVRVFLDALLALPRSLWRPMIVIVDEAHDFCPETGREAESRESVVRLMDSGRKRGICGILATQRFAKLAKDAAAEANNVCVGHIVQDVDLKRASDILGFSGRSEWATLRDLEAGQWFAFGPAFAHRGIEKFTG
jgi:DNA helicase HerA-like ATPase